MVKKKDWNPTYQTSGLKSRHTSWARAVLGFGVFLFVFFQSRYGSSPIWSPLDFAICHLQTDINTWSNCSRDKKIHISAPDGFWDSKLFRWGCNKFCLYRWDYRVQSINAHYQAKRLNSALDFLTMCIPYLSLHPVCLRGRWIWLRWLLAGVHKQTKENQDQTQEFQSCF